jgi:hypothetical protein
MKNNNKLIAYNKVSNVINSCQTSLQIRSAEKMTKLFLKFVVNSDDDMEYYKSLLYLLKQKIILLKNESLHK